MSRINEDALVEGWIRGEINEQAEILFESQRENVIAVIRRDRPKPRSTSLTETQAFFTFVLPGQDSAHVRLASHRLLYETILGLIMAVCRFLRTRNAASDLRPVLPMKLAFPHHTSR